MQESTTGTELASSSRDLPTSAARTIEKSSWKALYERHSDISHALTHLLRHEAISHGVFIRPDGFAKLQDVMTAHRVRELNCTVQEIEGENIRTLCDPRCARVCCIVHARFPLRYYNAGLHT